MRVLAASGGRRAWIGTIEAGTPLAVFAGDDRDAYRDVEVEGIRAANGARLAAERNVLDACSAVTPPR